MLRMARLGFRRRLDLRPILLLASALALPAADYDLLIRGARVVDGMGNPWFRADVGIRGGKIAGLGRLAGATADRVVEANGRVLAPGFIDVHTHVEVRDYRPGIDQFPEAANYITDGVTTVVTGNCGTSEIDLAVWFAKLDKLGLGLNLASLIGHNSVRSEVMGAENRPATPDEIRRMQELVDRGMRAGAVGFSTGLIYIPGAYANTEEVVALAQAAGRHGGVYATHMRDEGEKITEAITEAVRVGREAGTPVQISHFKVSNRRLWGSSDRTIALVEKFRQEGVDVVVDQYPYVRSSTGLSTTLPSWALAGGQAGIRERLANPETRARIARQMAERLRQLGHEDYSYATVASCRFDRSIEGKTISEVNTMRGRPKTVAAEVETILDLVAQGVVPMVFHSMGEQDVERILRYPNTAVASDGYIIEHGSGAPHPRSYGTNARVLAEYVRKRQVLTLEDAVRRMTSLPARTFGFRDRGVVREGLAADLVLFDPQRVADRSTFDQPHQYSEGFDLVLVGGVAVVENGKPTGKRPGRVVRRQ